MHKRRHILGLLISACSLGFASQVAAQTNVSADPNYPTKPIRFIVPFPPGGAADILARQVGQKLTEAWRQPVIVDNRAGATGTIGTAIVAKANPDGYSVLVGPTAVFTVAPSLYRSLPFDPIKDFQPVTIAVLNTNVLVVKSESPIKTVSELVAAAKASPGTLHYGSGGIGGSDHLAGEVFREIAGLNIVHVPYKGGAPALTALLGGEIQLLFGVASTVLPHIASGKLRALAVSGSKRLGTLPNLPTMNEAGISGYDVTTWYGFLLPAGTPKEIVTKLNVEIGRALKSPDLSEKLISQGFEPFPTTPEQFGARIRADHARWTGVLSKLGLKPE